MKTRTVIPLILTFTLFFLVSIDPVLARSPLSVLQKHKTAGMTSAPAIVGPLKARVATYNIAHARGNKRGGLNELGNIWNLNGIAKLLQSQKVDIVGLTEVSGPDFRAGLIDQPAFLAMRLGFRYAYGENVRDGLILVAQGNAVLSRYPIVSAKNHKLFRKDSKQEQRACMEAVLAMGNNRKCRVLVAHLSLDGEEAQKQIEQIWGIAEKSTDPVILMGDFNSHPGDARIKWLSERMTDITSNVNTTYMNNPGDKIDFIFVKGAVQSAGTASVTGFKEGYSDHGCLLNDVTLFP